MKPPTYIYWPYDEVSIAPAGADRVVVKSPWLQAEVDVPESARANVDELLQKIQKNELTPNDVELVHWFFSSFQNVPLCYILPFPKEGTDQHTLKETSLADASLEAILTSATKNKSIVDHVLKNLPKQHFSWDIPGALSFSGQENLIHPESLLTVARRQHLLGLLADDRGHAVFRYIESLTGEEFAKAVSKVVKQNLYVTEQCQAALLPAVAIAQSASAEVEHFIQAERGHDKILGAALRSIGSSADGASVSPQTEALMSLLKLTAERNFLAFAIAVDYFERNSYEKMDPLAKLLLKGGFQEAAKQINRHMEINDSGGHENMGLKFLAAMKPCDPAYAREALKLAEAVSLVMNSVTGATRLD